jgi:putative chitinase
MFDANTLAIACGATIGRATVFLPWLTWACETYEIDTPARQAAFFAQIGHESGGLKWTSEIWGPTPQQRRYERNFTAPWPSHPDEAKLPAFAVNRLAYGLGNSVAGDGSKFRGHGLIQTTGRANHIRVRDRLTTRFAGMDVPNFELEPIRLISPDWASVSAADFWDMRGLNALADTGDFERITRRINGGVNGLADRLARWEKARSVLN